MHSPKRQRTKTISQRSARQRLSRHPLTLMPRAGCARPQRSDAGEHPVRKASGLVDEAERFVRGEDTYDVVLRNLQKEGSETDVTIPDVGPRAFRYSEDDRAQTPRFWMSKLQREANAFAHEVVRAAAAFPQMVISSPALRAGYARLKTLLDDRA